MVIYPVDVTVGDPVDPAVVGAGAHVGVLVEEHVDRVVQLSTLNHGQRQQMDMTQTIQIHQLHQ